MKKLILSLSAAFGLILSVNAQVTTYSVGEVVDNFTVTDTEGNEHDLYTITASGKYVYIDFFFDTCGPCQLASPHFGEFYDKYGCNGGEVYCLVVNDGSDSDAETIAYEEEFGGPGNHAPAISADGGGGAVDAAFGIGAYPTFCMIGPDNKLMFADIWPVSSIEDFEATFGGDFNPSPMPCSALGIEENEVSELSVYPNPANEQTMVTFNSINNEEATIQIYSILGEIVQTSLVSVVEGKNTIELNLAAFETGNYIVKIQLSNEVSTTRFEVIH